MSTVSHCPLCTDEGTYDCSSFTAHLKKHPPGLRTIHRRAIFDSLDLQHCTKCDKLLFNANSLSSHVGRYHKDERLTIPCPNRWIPRPGSSTIPTAIAPTLFPQTPNTDATVVTAAAVATTTSSAAPAIVADDATPAATTAASTDATAATDAATAASIAVATTAATTDAIIAAAATTAATTAVTDAATAASIAAATTAAFAATTAITDFQCPCCLDVNPSSESLLHEHLQLHGGAGGLPTLICHPTNPHLTSINQCLVCRRLFLHRRGLSNHMKSKHPTVPDHGYNFLDPHAAATSTKAHYRNAAQRQLVARQEIQTVIPALFAQMHHTVAATGPDDPADTQQALATNRTTVARFFQAYNKGLYEINHHWETPLRKLSTLLIQQITLNDAHHLAHVTAFLILPGLFDYVRLIKRPCKRPIDFLNRAFSLNNDASSYILHSANLLLPFVDALRKKQLNRSRRRNGSTRPTSKPHHRRRIQKLVRQSRLSAAANVLEFANNLFSDASFVPPAPPSNQEIIESLQRLNPNATDADLLPASVIDDNEVAPPPITFNRETVCTVLKLLPTGSANGASGWTCGIIRRLYSDGDSTDFDAIAALFNALVSGSLPSTHWITSRAVLIPKPNNNGFRPLGIGEAWYRFLGRAILSLVGENVGSRLEPLQLGCGIPGGCESAARMAQVFLDNLPSHVLIKTDFTNAFNLVPRRRIFEGLQRFCPQLLPWFRWAYGAPSPLVNSQGVIVGSSETGCRQGDPLASLLFCVAIHPALQRLNDEISALYDNAIGLYPDDELGPDRGIVLSYMDDCTISVPWILAPDVTDTLITICNEFGLILNHPKCRVIGPNSLHLSDMYPFQKCADGDIVLGNPVGSASFRRNFCEEQVVKYTRCLPTINTLQIDPSPAFNLIKFCINPRINYLVRVQDVDSRESVQAFDEAIDEALFQVAHHQPATVDRRCLSAMLRSLPLDLGGLGVKRYTWIAGDGAIIRSRIYLKHHIDTHYETHPTLPHIVAYLPEINVGETICPMPNLLPLLPLDNTPNDRAMSDDHAIIIEETSNFADVVESQYSKFADHTVRALIAPSSSPIHSLHRAAWFRSAQFEGSGRWTSPPAATTLPPESTLSAEEYRCALRQRLLLAPFEDTEPASHPDTCTCRNEPELSDKTAPFHYLDCELTQPTTTLRHDCCQDTVIASFLKKRLAHRSCQITFRPRLHHTNGTELNEKGDIAVHLIPDVFKIIDVTIINPAATTYVDHSQSHLHIDAAATAKELEKLNKYAHTREVNEGKFLPFAIEATGRLSPKAYSWLEELLPDEIADCRALRRRDPVQQLQARLCTVITKFNAKMALHHQRQTWRHHLGVVTAQD